ncbi:TIR domain-containing protein [Paratractidigestivibacter faecalis]|uniref:TIR domain-containing protein n=1 Tax=Paratractidigestivibacter faecalis TaxID=2292441 RepID=UPI003CFD116A
MCTLQHWNESSRWGLSFVDARELTQARDTSLPCSIKRSLRERLDASKTFVLVVGDKTKDLSCRYCVSYSPYGACHRSGLVDHRSFIEYECEYAAAINRIVRHGRLVQFCGESRRVRHALMREGQPLKRRARPRCSGCPISDALFAQILLTKHTATSSSTSRAS